MSVFVISSVSLTFCMAGTVLTLAESLCSYVYILEFTLWFGGFFGFWGAFVG